MSDSSIDRKPLSKSQLIANVAEAAGLSKDDVTRVLDALSVQIQNSLRSGGSGAFVLPGLLKIEKKVVPAKEARYGVPNPFKPGETMDVAAKPESSKVKIRPLKNLKDMI